MGTDPNPLNYTRQAFRQWCHTQTGLSMVVGNFITALLFKSGNGLKLKENSHASEAVLQGTTNQPCTQAHVWNKATPACSPHPITLSYNFHLQITTQQQPTAENITASLKKIQQL